MVVDSLGEVLSSAAVVIVGSGAIVDTTLVIDTDGIVSIGPVPDPGGEGFVTSMVVDSVATGALTKKMVEY